MIKKLINDLAYEKVTLTKALNIAKLIAFKIDNDSFKSWIKSELNGYNETDLLPDYRKLVCDIFAKIENPYHGARLVPMDLSSLDDKVNWDIYVYDQLSSIDAIEKNLQEVEGSSQFFGYIDFPVQMVSSMRALTKEPYLTAVKRRLEFGQLQNIINITKQRLLDTLLELNEAFPNMEDEFMNSDVNEKIASQIITTNIYGNNASSNVGIGNDFSQGISNSYSDKVQQVLNDLRELGIPDEDINELQTVIESEKNKDKLGSKLLKWCAEMATKAVEKGIDDKVPAIVEAVQSLIL